MKICVLGLDCAVPEVIFGDERLMNLRRLMDFGVYGRLESVVPPITVPAWMCMTTSQDPGSLGVYGLRNRRDHSYDSLAFADSGSSSASTIWDQIARAGKKSIIVGVPPNYPPRQVNGISIGCVLTPDSVKNDFTYPPAFKAKINELVGEYPVDVRDFRADKKDWLKEEIFNVSRKQWTVVRWLLAEQEWDYFHFLDIGLDRMLHAFWSDFDPKHAQFEPSNDYQDAIPEYYRWLDEQIGSVLGLLDNDTIVLVLSAYGAQRLDGGFAINEWLIREGLLVLNEYPKTLAPFEKLNVNWGKTKAWSEGGNYGQVFFNVQGREPQGIVPASEYESFQDEMKARLEALPGENDQPMKALVFKPKEIYRNVRNVAPDLIVQVGDAQYGMFILTAPNSPLNGEYDGARLLDIAPTLLDLAGYEIPETMQGRSLVSGMEKKSSGGSSDEESKKIVHDRLAGLGYV
jgi:predicted AlkP superfamily phosphohydrolase/phosphomutase